MSLIIELFIGMDFGDAAVIDLCKDFNYWFQRCIPLNPFHLEEAIAKSIVVLPLHFYFGLYKKGLSEARSRRFKKSFDK